MAGRGGTGAHREEQAAQAGAAALPRQPLDHEQRNFRDELLALALATMGENRVMFSVDYPMASARVGAHWFRSFDPPPATKEKTAHRNTRGLLIDAWSRRIVDYTLDRQT